MKIISISDLHGRNIWKTIIKKPADRYVFLGDYFDTHDNIPAHKQIKNFEEILNFKLANPQKVKLLIGNHDYHYLPDAQETYSGYQNEHRDDIQSLLVRALRVDALQPCFVHNQYLFVHAGITKTWCVTNNIDTDFIEPELKILFDANKQAFKFTPGENSSPFGDDITQSPFWVRPASLVKDQIGGYIQVVGHTQTSKLIIDEDLILTDCLGTSKEVLIIIDRKASVIRS